MLILNSISCFYLNKIGLLNINTIWLNSHKLLNNKNHDVVDSDIDLYDEYINKCCGEVNETNELKELDNIYLKLLQKKILTNVKFNNTISNNTISNNK